MRVRPGSDNYFVSEKNQLAKVGKISTQKQNFLSVWFAKIRIKMFGEQVITGKVKSEIEQFNIKANTANAEYNKKIDDFVLNIVNEFKNDAFKQFCTGIKSLMDTAHQFDARRFPEDLPKYPELNLALNKLCGGRRSEVIEVLKEFPNILNGLNHVDSDPQSEFDLLLKKLKDEFNKDSASGMYLGVNLASIDSAMKWDWKTSNPIHEKLKEFLVGDAEKRKAALFKDVIEWAKKMKEQRGALVAVIPKSATVKKENYSLLADQLQAVKEISQIQMERVAEKKSLERSVVNFIADQAKKSYDSIATELKSIKNDHNLTNNLQRIKECEKEIAKIYDQMGPLDPNDENYAKLKTNLERCKQEKKIRKSGAKVYKDNQKIFLESVEKDFIKKHEKVKDAASQTTGRVSTKEITALMNLYTQSTEVKEKIVNAKEIYEINLKWGIYRWAIENFPAPTQVTDDSTREECETLIANCNDYFVQLTGIQLAIKALSNEVKKDLRLSVPDVEDPVDSETFLAILQDLIDGYKAGKTAALCQKLDLGFIEQSNAALLQPLEKSDLDLVWISDFHAENPQYELRAVATNENSLFTACLSGMRGIDSLELQEFIDYTPENLRAAVYTHMQGAENSYFADISEFLMNGIANYAEANEATAKRQLTEIAPDLKLIFQRFRREYLVVKENPVELEAWNTKLTELAADPQILNLYMQSMPNCKANVGLAEVKALQALIGVPIRVHTAEGDLNFGEDSPLAIKLFRTEDQRHFDAFVKKEI